MVYGLFIIFGCVIVTVDSFIMSRIFETQNQFVIRFPEEIAERI